ncbi:histidine kinase [Flavobacterium sp. DGU11]|uniref:Histidine kinase n=1 Tax=Flavobacterium arundinis TaxID=3139143 RepID=A0ABU9HTF2_9FLAO
MPVRFLLHIVFSATILLAGCSALAQKQPKDAFRLKIDSLNAVAADHPVAVLREANPMMVEAKKQKRTVDYGLLLMVKGVAETSLGNNAVALKNHMRAYHIFDSIKNNTCKVYSLCSIASVYLNSEDYKKAEDYLYKALAVPGKKDDHSYKTIYVNLGVVYQYGGDAAKSIVYYNKAMPFLEALRDDNGLAVTCHDIAESYNMLGNFKEAEKYELKALDYQKRSGSQNALAIISLALGSLYTDYGHTEKALKYLEAGGKAAFELDSPYYKDIYYQSMAEWHKAKGQYKDEAEYLNKLIHLRDTIHVEETGRIQLALEEEFQNNIKTKEIEILKTQKKLDESKIERNRIWWVVFFTISMLCLAIIVILYRNYKLKQKANKLLGYEKSQLEEQNLRLENENILVQFETLRNQVSPHFLFNSLNALASLIKRDPDKALEFTGVFSKIFRNTLELKDRHLITVGEEIQHVQSYLYLQKMRFGDSLIVDISVPSANLKQYLPPFSLQMGVENAIKHNVITIQQPLTIKVDVADGALVVANNFQPRQHVEDSTGTGIKNIISRYKYLNTAEPVFEVRNDEYIVELPLINEE